MQLGTTLISALVVTAISTIGCSLTRGAAMDTQPSVNGVREKQVAHGEEASRPVDQAAAQRGAQKIAHETYMPPYFTKALLGQLVSVWDGKDAEEAKGADPLKLKAIASRRYGFLEAPYENEGAPVNFVPGPKGWSLSCFECHAGQLMGMTILGLGNNRLDQQTMMEDIVRLKAKVAAAAPIPEAIRAQAIPIPFGAAMGTSNGLGLAAGLLAMRTPDLAVRPPMDFGNGAPPMDAPPWWNIKKKLKTFYIDGMVAAGPRSMEHALLFPENSAQFIKEKLADFEDIFEWMDTLQPPKYPGHIDADLAAAGRGAFNRVCAGCHGTYGAAGHYPDRMVDIDVIGTDRTRLDGISRKFRDYYATTWFTDYGRNRGQVPTGYIAPPLDGIWASAPYLHNGSVPTLMGILDAKRRPRVWRAVRDGDPAASYDLNSVGLAVEAGVTSVPVGLPSSEARRYYDTAIEGQANSGHTFPDAYLNASEKHAVLEYLKTL